MGSNPTLGTVSQEPLKLESGETLMPDEKPFVTSKGIEVTLTVSLAIPIEKLPPELIQQLELVNSYGNTVQSGKRMSPGQRFKMEKTIAEVDERLFLLACEHFKSNPLTIDGECPVTFHPKQGASLPNPAVIWEG